MTTCPVDTKHWTNVDLMLGQRRRRCPNFKSELVQRPVIVVLVIWWEYVWAFDQRVDMWHKRGVPGVWLQWHPSKREQLI